MDHHITAKPNLKGDWWNVCLLLLLYFMQGLPLGLSKAVPILLQSKKSTTYQDQAVFNLSSWPFSVKFLLAPLVDALYVKKFGRRKSWLIPVQYLIGAFLLYMAYDFDNLIPESGKPNIRVLAYTFFTVCILAATQDIVIDGWALTLLKKNNVGYASTCNVMGQGLGVVFGFGISVLLTSEGFLNKNLRDVPHLGEMVTIQSFLYLCGFLFMLVTTLVAIFIKEKDYILNDGHLQLNIAQSYSILWKILKLPSIRLLAIIVITAKFQFAATENVTTFKLIDDGIPKDNIVLIDSIKHMINIFVPLFIAKQTSGPKPMSVYLKATLIRLLWSLTFMITVYFTPIMITTNGIINVPKYYFVILFLTIIINKVLYCIMSVAVMAFYARISDPNFGSTYMTLLNAFLNFGNVLSSTTALGLIDFLTFKECSIDSQNTCSTLDTKKVCQSMGGHCIIKVDGYYTEFTFCIIFGLAWYVTFKNATKSLQMKSQSHWSVKRSNQLQDFPLVLKS